MPNVLNGWDLDAMTEAIEGVRKQPEAGKLNWRGRVTWDGGFGLDVRTEEIEQLGQSMKRHFTMRGDHPPELLGNNTGPTAIETVMAALGACIAGTFAAQATARGVEIESLEVDVEATIDLNGFFGLQPIRPGLSDVKLAFHVEADADPSVLQEMIETAESLSPVFDTVTRPVAVQTTLATVGGGKAAASAPRGVYGG